MLNEENTKLDVMVEGVDLGVRCGHSVALSEDNKLSVVVKDRTKRWPNIQVREKKRTRKSMEAKWVDDDELTSSRLITPTHDGGATIGALSYRLKPELIEIQPSCIVNVPISEAIVVRQHDNLCQMSSILEQLSCLSMSILGPWLAYRTLETTIGRVRNLYSAAEWISPVSKVSTTQRRDLPMSLDGRDHGGRNDGDSLGEYGGKSRVHRFIPILG